MKEVERYSTGEAKIQHRLAIAILFLIAGHTYRTAIVPSHLTIEQ